MRITLLMFLTMFLNTVMSQSHESGILMQRLDINKGVHDNGIRYYTDKLNLNPDDVKSRLLRSELYRSLNMRIEANNDERLATSANPYAFLYTKVEARKSFFDTRTYAYNLNFEENSNTFSKSYLLFNEYKNLLKSGFISTEAKDLLEVTLMDINNGDFKVASEQLASIQEEFKMHPLYLDLKGVLKLEKGEIEEAITFFSKAIDMNPDFTIAYHNRAVAYKISGNYDAAEQDFKEAMMRQADNAKIKFSKAKLHELKGDSENAKRYYKYAVESSDLDGYPEARLNYNVLLKATGEYTKAIIESNKLISDYPENLENYYVRGGIYFIYGEYENAIEDFEEYLDGNPDDSDALLYKGVSQVLLGNRFQGCENIHSSIDKGRKDNIDLSLYMCD